MRNLNLLKEKILNGKYRMRRLIRFKVYEPKEREVVADQLEDKIVQDVLSKYVLRPLIAPKLIYDNYASQPGKGNLLAVQRLEKFMVAFAKDMNWTNAGWVLVCDIKKYFYSIDHAAYLSMIDELYMDDKLKALMHHQTEVCTKDINPYVDIDGKGLCIGFQTSQWGAIYYLNGLDHFIKEKLGIKYYGRYMDDFYLIHESREYLEHCLNQIRDYVENKLKLTLNRKTHIHKYSQGICFLGYRCTFNERTHEIDTHIRNKSIKKMRRRSNKNYKAVAMGLMTVQDAKASLDSWWSYAQHGVTRKAKNAYAAECKRLQVLNHEKAIEHHHKMLMDETNIDPDGFLILKPKVDKFGFDAEGFITLIPHKVSMKEARLEGECEAVKSRPEEYTDINYKYLTGVYKPPKKRKLKGGSKSKRYKNTDEYVVETNFMLGTLKGNMVKSHMAKTNSTMGSAAAKALRNGLNHFKF